MTTKHTENIIRLQSQLDSILQESYFKDLPKEVRKSIAQAKVELMQYLPQTKEIKDINQHIATQEEVIDLLIEATGYSRWSLSTDNIEDVKEVELRSIKRKYDINFNEEDVETYTFYRSTGNRSSVSGVKITALPGCFYVGMNTDRSEIYFETLLSKKEAVNKIQVEFDNN